MDALLVTEQQRMQLREALYRLRGACINVDVAATIEHFAYLQVDASIDPERFEVVEHRGYVFRAERLRDVLPELRPLHEAQWQETEQHRHDVGFNPDEKRGLMYESAGGLVQFTVRRDDELVGHMRLFVPVSMHTSTQFAHEDTLYIKPEHRNGLLGSAFVKYIEVQLLSALGINEVRFDVKHTNKASAIPRRRGYEPVSTRYVKILKG